MRIITKGTINELEEFLKKNHIPLDPHDKQVRKECVREYEADELLEEINEDAQNNNSKKTGKYVAVHIAHPLGFSAIHVAAANGRKDMVEWLIVHGADVNEKETFNMSIPSKSKSSASFTFYKQ